MARQRTRNRRGRPHGSGRRGLRDLVAGLVLLACSATPAWAESCEIHPSYNAEFRKSLISALYGVRNQQQLTYVLYQMIVIDRETTAHEEAHYRAAQGWAERPVYETVELYGKAYRIGGCVLTKPGIPLEIAYAAALAPKQPSEHDKRLARKFMMEMQRLGMR